MAKYNILDEDDIFSESEEEKQSSDTSKGKKEQEEPEINIDGEEIFDDSLLEEERKRESEPDLRDEKPDEDIDLDLQEDRPTEEQDEKLKDFFADEEEVRKNLEQKPEEDVDVEQEEPSDVHDIIEEYEDEKLGGLNFKPFLIGGIIIILLIAGYFIVDLWVLGEGGDTTAEVTEQAVPQEPQLSPEEIRKNQELARLAGRSSNELSFINDIIGITSGENGNLSSLLLYDKSFMLEVFGKNRAELAKVQKAMQTSMPQQRFDIVSADIRPGEAGGILGIYSLLINGGSTSKEVNRKFTSVQEARSWLSSLSNANGLELQTFRETSTDRENGFRVLEIEALLSGNLNNCKTILKEMAEAAPNLKIHKLNMTTTDQRSFSPSTFQLKMIIQIYV